MRHNVITGLAMSVLLVASPCATAGDWKFGFSVSYLSGVQDVIDLTEQNIEEENPNTDVQSFGFPIGPGFATKYQVDNGLRFDFGVGPVFAFISDLADHTEVPVYGTVGFTFMPSADTSPYARIGGAYHFASGDYVESSSAGPFGAVGVEFSRNSGPLFALELAYDGSSVEVIDVAEGDTVDLNTYDVMLTFMMLF